MARQVNVVAVYALPATLEVAPSCFAKSFQANIGDLNAKVTLPRIAWEPDGPHIVAPAMDAEIARYIAHFVVDTRQGWEKWHFWGQVVAHNPSKQKIIRARLGAILLEFKCDPASITYSEYLHGRGHPQGANINQLFQSIDDWFERIRTWVETAINQDVDPLHPLTTSTLQAAGLHVFTIEGTTVSLPASANQMSVNLSTYELISLSLLRKIVRLVNADVVPSDAQLLLRDARGEFRRGRYRRTVIDAGSATEITLADFNRRVTLVNVGPRPTLGRYTKQPQIVVQGKLPTNIGRDLVDIRNEAIHQNKLPTRDEAKLALALAKQVVDRLDPLPL